MNLRDTAANAAISTAVSVIVTLLATTFLAPYAAQWLSPRPDIEITGGVQKHKVFAAAGAEVRVQLKNTGRAPAKSVVVDIQVPSLLTRSRLIGEPSGTPCDVHEMAFKDPDQGTAVELPVLWTAFIPRVIARVRCDRLNPSDEWSAIFQIEPPAVAPSKWPSALDPTVSISVTARVEGKTFTGTIDGTMKSAPGFSR